MDKEQYNSFDDWFREAAAQPGPDFNEEAWQKMEVLLDGEKKKRRRIIFWWWFTGILVGGSLLIYSSDNMFRGQPLGRKNDKIGLTIPIPSDSKMPGSKISNGGKIVPEIKDRFIKTNSWNKTSQGVNIHQPTLGFQDTNRPVKISNPSQEKSVVAKENSTAGEQPPVAGPPAIDSKDTHQTVGDSIKYFEETTLKDSIVPATVGKKMGKGKPERKNHVYLFGTVAPEWTFVKSRGPGSTAVSYGGGIGYAISGKWAIQAGLYSSRKKYLAGEGDYTPKPGSYYDNPNYVIESVDADCSVLEIPVSVRFTFLQKHRTSLFVMAGVSTAIMKKEAYVYDYMRYGNPAYSSYTYKSGVAHFFSAASASVGFERRLNSRVSLLLVPYFTMPLEGIGEGKVHLNSFGVQGGLTYKLPF